MTDFVQTIFSALGKFTPYVLLALIALTSVAGALFFVGIAINLKYILFGVGIAAGLAFIYFIVKKVMAKKE